jgi:hypothetical protein
VGHFVEEAANWKTLAAMSVGSIAYRLGRLGTLALAGEASSAAPVLRLASYGSGLASEVTAFEMTNRSLTSLTEDASRNPNLWRWSGTGGIAQGLANSFVAFGTLKGFGRLAQSENAAIQHLFQDSGMVLGNQLSSALGITSAPTGTLAEQFLHAEATNLQLGVGMALTQFAAPGLHGMERALDLNLQSQSPARSSFRNLFSSSENHFGNGLRPALSPAGVGATESGRSSSSPIEPLILHMSSNDRPGGKGEDSSVSIITEAGTRLKVPVGSRAFLIPDESQLEQGIREFIEGFDFPVAVAKMGGMFAMGLGDLFMVNEAFVRDFGWPHEEATNHSVTYYFPKGELLGVINRVREIQKKNGGVFEPTDLSFKHKDRSLGHIPITGSGIIRNIYGRDIAFGFLKPKSKTAAQTAQGDQLTEMLRATNAMNQLEIDHDGSIPFHSFMGINIQFMDPESPLLKRLEKDRDAPLESQGKTPVHLRVRITGTNLTGDDLREYVPSLIQSLNLKSKKFSFIRGSTLRMEIAATQSSVLVLRKSDAEGWVVTNENFAGFGPKISIRPPAASSEEGEGESPWLKSIRQLGGAVPPKKDDPGKK